MPKKIRETPRYSNRGQECLAPGCHRADTQPVYPLGIPTGETTPEGGVVMRELMFRYCPVHMTRPYAYEQRGRTAPEIEEAIAQWRRTHGIVQVPQDAPHVDYDGEPL